MLSRLLKPTLENRLQQFPAVALFGPRQCGKTTLALAVAEARRDQAVYLDLENPADRRRLDDPVAYLSAQRGRLVVLDEIHRLPEIFAVLRSEIDARRRAGEPAGQFLILGSAALDLLRQSSESLAGRIDFLELTPFQPQEIADPIDRLWIRGGFPGSFLADSDSASAAWRRAFIRSYLERDIPQFGVRVPAETIERFWTMLAHSQGGLFNGQRLAQSLGVGWHAVAHYLDLLVDLLLVRRLQPWASRALPEKCEAVFGKRSATNQKARAETGRKGFCSSTGKRLVKSPKVYLRDSGLLHSLLNLPSLNDVLGHPVAGASWEGFAIEAILAAAPAGTKPYFYRTATGHEIDLVLEFSATRRWAVEIKKTLSPTVEKGFHIASTDIKAERRLVVYTGHETYPGPGGLEFMPLLDAVRAIEADWGVGT